MGYVVSDGDIVGKERVGKSEGVGTEGICVGEYRGRRGRIEKEEQWGGMVVGIRKGIKRIRECEGKDGVIDVKVRLEEEWSWLIRIYANKDLEIKLEKLKDWIDERVEGTRVLIGGDFNAKTGREGGRVEEGGG